MESAGRAGPVHYRTAAAVGVGVFYREAGPDSGSVVLLLHGFPSSSRMFRDLIPRLSDAYHVIAPDYPAFGHSAVPGRSAFGYTFDHLAEVVDGLLGQLGIGTFAIYVMDFGAAVGFRLALRHPERCAGGLAAPSIASPGPDAMAAAPCWLASTVRARHCAPRHTRSGLPPPAMRADRCLRLGLLRGPGRGRAFRGRRADGREPAGPWQRCDRPDWDPGRCHLPQRDRS
jgi:pimeloyl-ACP methyl ester carboxylesterase